MVVNEISDKEKEEMKFRITGLDKNENFQEIGKACNLNNSRSLALQAINRGYSDVTIENIKTGYIRRVLPNLVDIYTEAIKIDC